MKTSQVQESLRIFPGIAEVPEAIFSVLVGRLLCRHMRDMLEEEVFCGRPIRWREGSGWIERTFTVTGPVEHVRQVKQRIDYWASALQQMDSM